MGSYLLYDCVVFVFFGSLLILFFVLIFICRFLNVINCICFIIEFWWMKLFDLYFCLFVVFDCNVVLMFVVVEVCCWKCKSKLCGLMFFFCVEVCRFSLLKYIYFVCCLCFLFSYFIEVSWSWFSLLINNIIISWRLFNFV